MIAEEAIIPVEDPWENIWHLCYIPVFGGGFGFPLQEVLKMPVSLREKALKWLTEQREKENKMFKSGKGGSGQMPTTSPSLHSPESPQRR